MIANFSLQGTTYKFEFFFFFDRTDVVCLLIFQFVLSKHFKSISYSDEFKYLQFWVKIHIKSQNRNKKYPVIIVFKPTKNQHF